MADACSHVIYARHVGKQNGKLPCKSSIGLWPIR